MDFRLTNTWFVSKFDHHSLPQFFSLPPQILKEVHSQKSSEPLSWPAVMVHAIWVRGQFDLQNKYQDSQGYMEKSCLKTLPPNPTELWVCLSSWKETDHIQTTQENHRRHSHPDPNISLSDRSTLHSRKFSLCGILWDLEQEWVSSFPDMIAMEVLCRGDHLLTWELRVQSPLEEADNSHCPISARLLSYLEKTRAYTLNLSSRTQWARAVPSHGPDARWPLLFTLCV